MTPSRLADATHWEIVIDQLACRATLGIYPHERAPQPVLIDAVLHYRQAGLLDGIEQCLDYHRYCELLKAHLERPVHTELVEQLLIELLALSFRRFPQLEHAELALFKPEAVPAARRVGVRAAWSRVDYERWCARDAGRAVARRDAVLA